jgi:hypothetical protein
MVTHDERWRPASEAPECEQGSSIRVIIEDNHGETHDGLYSRDAIVDGRLYKGFQVVSEKYHRFLMQVARWRYWPEPPTPEQEERRRLEERVLAYGAKCLLGHPHTDGATEEIRAILREWAAKPV